MEETQVNLGALIPPRRPDIKKGGWSFEEEVGASFIIHVVPSITCNSTIHSRQDRMQATCDASVHYSLSF